MTRRVIIGKRPDGTFGLSVSLPGVDVVTADPFGGGMSFDDRWTDIVKIALTGIAVAPGGSFSSALPPPTTPISHGLGFVPFIEARLLSSASIINDDIMGVSSFLSSNRLSGVPMVVDTSNITLLAQQSGASSGGFTPYVAYSTVFVVYNLANPNPS